MKSVDDRSLSFPVALALVVLLVAYGSLFPFQWNFNAPQAFIWSGRIGLVDLIENIALFVPLGGLLGWAGQGRPRKWVFFAAWLVAAIVLASALQWLQKFLPRTPALSDVIFNMAGYALGWGAGFAARWRVGHLLNRHQGWADADQFTLVLIALWCVAELYPLIPALDAVGDGFEKGTVFLPQLLQAATAAQAAFEAIKAKIAASGQAQGSKGKIVIATVKGDVHDIGKNIVRVILENYGYDVLDLGRDVDPERVVEAVRQTGAKLVGLSALMTTTVPNMQATIEALHAAHLDCKVMVGGAVLTPDYARDIGADYYCKDAKASADLAKQLLG